MSSDRIPCMCVGVGPGIAGPHYEGEPGCRKRIGAFDPPNAWTGALLEAGLLPPRSRVGPAFLRRSGAAWRTDPLAVGAVDGAFFAAILREARDGRRWRITARPITAWSADLGPVQDDPPPYVVVRDEAGTLADLALPSLVLFNAEVVFDLTGPRVTFTLFEPADLRYC